MATRAARNFAALALYLAISLVLLGPAVIPNMHDRVLTTLPGDWGLFVWSFSWWPHALVHGLNPLFTRDLWSPTGINLSWTTITPFPSLLLAPITAAFGPVVSFNVAALLAPATSAWTAYLFCSRLTGRALKPSLAGGFVFGFSPYVIAQVFAGHLNLSFALMIPLCAYLIVCLLRQEMRPRRFVILMTACLVVQAGISIEIFATMLAFAGIAGALGMIFGQPQQRRRLIASAGWLAVSYAAACVVLSPYMYAMVAYPQPFTPIFAHPVAPILVSDLPRLILPGRPEIFGLNFGDPTQWVWYYHLERFGWYLPLPFLVIVVHLWLTERRRTAVKVATGAFVVAVVLALGPSIWFGTNRIPLPWSTVQVLPLIKRAFPYRLAAYSSLALAVCVAYWLASSSGSLKRWWVFGLGAILLLPNPAGVRWTRDVTLPAFFSSGEYQTYLTPGQVVWIVDLDGGRQMLWQASTSMYFRLPGGLTGVTPPGLADPHTESLLVAGRIGPADSAAIKAFVSSHGVGTVIVGDEPDWVVGEISGALGVAPVRTGGVILMQVVPAP